MPGYRKKLIEVALPLEAINRESARENFIYRGNPSAIHKWWAQRPLAVCRAMLFGQLVDDPSAWPERFPTEAAQAAERDRLHKLIERLVPWEASTDETILNEARWEIARSVAWNRGEEPPAKDDPAVVFDYLQTKAPPVYDPFCGGGSIPLEAQRLRLRAYGSDLNPVAVLISKALVEIPPKFAGLPPVNPEARAKIAAGALWQGKGAEGLAEDVRYYGRWIRDEALNRIGHLYPQATLPDGSKAPVIAWLWARTVSSPNPAAAKILVPLMRSFWLSTKPRRRVWLKPILDAASQTCRFEVQHGAGSPRDGTVNRRGAECLFTDTPISFEYIRNEGQAGRLGLCLLAIVASTEVGRTYLNADDEHVMAASVARPDELLDSSLPVQALGFRVQAYGLRHHRDLFTPRQLRCLATLSDLIGEARSAVIDNSNRNEEYANAVATYLAFSLDKTAEYSCSLVPWYTKEDRPKGIFARHAVPMVWDFAEVNPLSDIGGIFHASVRIVADVISDATCPAGSRTPLAIITQADARTARIPDGAFFATDPPYYDNIGYADLSDFFYVWLRKSLARYDRRLFSTTLTPKADELIATPYRFSGSREEARKFFQSGLRASFNQLARGSRDFPGSIFYAYKQAENGEKEEPERTGSGTSTGWETLLQALVDERFVIDGTWPVRSERSSRAISLDTNALASSILLACRNQYDRASLTSRASLLRDLKRELPAALKLLQAESIAPVDMAQASIGPGMAIFSRYAKVLNADDSAMTVKEALQDINAALDAFLSEQEAEYDAYTRFAITWFEQNGMAIADYGTAEVLATARGVSVEGVYGAGVVERGGGKVRLKRREEMNSAAAGTVWGSAQRLIHRLMDDSEEAAAEALAQLGARAEAAKDLAYRLYTICERKKWADEGLAYNALVASWPRLVERAKSFATGPAQGTLAV